MKELSLLLSPVALLFFTVYAGAWEVLVVDAVAEPGVEFQFLNDNVKEVQSKEVNYTQILTTGLEKEIQAKHYDVVWLTWNCSSDDGAFYRDNDAAAIDEYVQAGGVLVTSATDDNGWKSD